MTPPERLSKGPRLSECYREGVVKVRHIDSDYHRAQESLRPSLNKKLFPVGCPSGIKRAD